MKKLSILLVVLLTLGQVLAEEGTATIYIRRTSFMYSGCIRHTLTINKVSIGSISPGDCLSIAVPVGNVVIKDTITIQETMSKNVFRYSDISITTQPNGKYFILLDDNNFSLKSELGKEKKYKATRELNIASMLQLEVSSNNMTRAGNSSDKTTVIQSDVDTNIPQSKKTADDTYALIIANEDYEFVDPVNFASHDGEVFKEYCIKTLGIPEKQVRYCANATYGVISGGVDWLKYALDNFEGSKAIVYYCGHGIPDEKTGDAYIVPVDGKGTNTATCYSLNKLYTTLAATKATNVTYFMDACFTGANKEGSMLVAARGVAREAKKEQLDGNAVVFSASSADETAMTYPEKGHGLFTYFLLKKLQETEGNVSYEELAGYINRNVKKEAFLINEKPQTPVVATSPAASSTWKSMKL